MRHHHRAFLLVATLAALLLAAAPAAANHLPESDAEGLAVLHAYYPGYWWDHTDLTVAVQAAPNVDPTLLQAAHDAIATWNDVLVAEFGGLITLTDVTGTVRNPHKADIVVHYVPRAGGVVFGGYAICGDHKCPNIIVRSDLPMAGYTYTYDELYWTTLHELGHALGLGHAEPIETTTDLMGYGWIYQGVAPVLSACDLRVLAVVFEWALAGASEPYPPTASFVEC